ncbi:MAG TPA: T9SS type A sorting domain-containing protein, partial [Puia sp.]
AGTVGVYPNITVTATDVLDSTATASFTLAVTEPNVSSVYVNFTGGPTCPKPWNTLLTPPFGGTVMSNLLDDGNTPTGISLTLPDGFYWFSASGRFTGNNDGVYPPAVIRSGLYEPTTATRRLQVSGLTVSKTYNFVFFNSQQDGTNGLTNFTINGQTVSLQASFNINKTVQINGIRPDANGGVTISVAKAGGASNAYISSLVIQGYATNASAVLNPTDLRVLSYTQGTVSLQWQDRSANETGFEVWRADNSGVYAKVANVAAGVVTYKDSRLSPNKDYYYIVRAIMGSTTSDYSNVAAVTTASDQIYLNVNSGSNQAGLAPSPWNNLNALPAIGVNWNNFKDSTGNPTSVSMIQTQDFAGLNAIGQTTGSNSGIYPDAVLMEDYVAFQGQVGGLQLYGLNLSKKYDLTFLASDNLFGDNTTAYAINGDTVFLNAMYNTTATVTMHGVTPDNTGRIDIKILPYGQASGGGWINAMVIQGYTQSSLNAPAPPQSAGGANRLTATATGASFNNAGQALAMDSTINAYPNPFQQFFTLQVPGFTNNDRVNLTVYNLSGQQIYTKEFNGLVQGQNFLRVDANQSFARSGIYIVRVVNLTNNSSKTFKLIKN